MSFFFLLSSELAAAVLMNVFHSGVYTYLVPVKSLAKEKFFFFLIINPHVSKATILIENKCLNLDIKRICKRNCNQIIVNSS